MNAGNDPHLTSALEELEKIKREFRLQEEREPQRVDDSKHRKASSTDLHDVDSGDHSTGGLKLGVADQLVNKLFQSNVDLEARLRAAHEPLVTMRAELKNAQAEAAWYKNHLEGFKARLTNACAQHEIENAVVPVLKETVHALEEENCELFVRLAMTLQQHEGEGA